MREFINDQWILRSDHKHMESGIEIIGIWNMSHLYFDWQAVERLHHLLGVWLQEMDNAET